MRVIKEKQGGIARQLLAAGKDVAAIARTIGVSRATIYRHVDVAGG